MTAITLDPKALSEAGVELKVTKQDLIDLVKETLEEQLELEVEDYKERYNAHQAVLRGFNDGKLAAFKKDVEANPAVKAYMDAIKAADKLGEKLIKETKRNGRKNEGEALEYTIDVQVGHGEWDDTNKVYVNNMHAYVARGGYHSAQLSALTKPVATAKELADIQAITKGFEDEWKDLQKKEKNMKSSTRAAKMAVVRAALGNTEQGKALLGILDSKSKVSSKALASVAGAVEEIKVISKSTKKRIEIQKEGK